ncbi:SUMF1/EgtB/PvdO family nonheme iron enzyme [Anaerocolumna xylanovorans]|uniref:Sulfatase-modifying factor enzyme 1 n=1 Tax=Anaerocolumna xylanovorans DSM 12503 TaxID=1121345 RepID=A0A1M7YBZ6_9FIRM|nr:SUMF1/EgtB/PvdO family nonheme iron enzyme [Anaerocolumna xylanovorans]SHO50160.1 Sulfatase-modifying factor enzyme 1 [Anaerocolumna xylanovorans DSM 12503]
MKHVKESVVLKYDNNGMPSFMVKVENTAPTPKEAERIFFVNGVEYDSIYLSQFLNSVFDGRAYSLPFQEPKTGISMDEMITACRAKGEGWHLLTNAEWKYIQDQTKKGVHGNTDVGSWHKDGNEKGIESDWGKTLTGSGPASWFHNGNKETGIADTVGNVWKTVSGMRLKKGVLQYMPDNNAAAPDADLSKESDQFVNLLSDDKPVKIGPRDGAIVITTGEVEDGWDAVERDEVLIDLKEIPEILSDLGVITKDADGVEESHEWFAADANLEEAVEFVGGRYSYTSYAGPSALNLSHPRSGVSANFGFFSACLGNPVTR